MGGSVTRQAFEAQGDVHQIFELFVAFDSGLKLRRFGKGGLELDAESGRDKLGETVNLSVGDVHGTADVFDGGFGSHGAEGNDLRNVFAAVLMSDVVNELAAAPHAEIDVDIGHGDTLGIEETFEEKIVLERV